MQVLNILLRNRDRSSDYKRNFRAVTSYKYHVTRITLGAKIANN